MVDSLFFTLFLQSFLSILAFVIGGCGVLLLAWGGLKAARRLFWVEAEPWKGPQQPKILEIRQVFFERILLGIDLLLAATLMRILIEPLPFILSTLGILTVVRVLLTLSRKWEAAPAPSEKPVRPSPRRRSIVL